ncbi:hypothetical protein [Arthrobacter sp. L77]|uniref:hypothetical protein n=1 Tax=Arthrobacter sp. L77 TaxID=1496689 RepID=UPI0005BCF500|nr:hypothetical protein [Arthrobacter sp. L77]
MSFIRWSRSVEARPAAELEGAGDSGPVQFADRATRRADARRQRANNRVIRQGRGRSLDQEAGMATAE